MGKTALVGSMQVLANGGTLNLRLERMAGDPPEGDLAGREGRTWYNEELHVLSCWNGTQIVRLPTRFVFESNEYASNFLVEHNLGTRYLHVTAVSRTTGLRMEGVSVLFVDENSLTVGLQGSVSDCTIICSF
jgi:hypothetical protein